MWEQQYGICIWAGTGLHTDLSVAHPGQDLPGPARILMLNCLFTCTSNSMKALTPIVEYCFPHPLRLSFSDLCSLLLNFLNFFV